MNVIRSWIDTHPWRAIGWGSIAVSVVLVYLEVVPRGQVLIETYQAWRANEDQVEQMSQWEAQRDRLVRRTAQLEAQVAARYVRIPRNDQMSVILDCLHESSEGTGLVLQQVKTTSLIEGSGHQKQPVHVLARGDFHGVGMFVDRIEQSPFLIEVVSLQVRREGTLKAPLQVELLLHAIVVER